MTVESLNRTAAARRNLLVAVGSRSDRVCSIGSFARTEARAFEPFFASVTVLEPDELDYFPDTSSVPRPDVIFFHAPALHDRKLPWNALLSAVKLRAAFPKAIFLSVVHEYTEAPLHWRLRQGALLKMSHGGIANTESDAASARKWNSQILRSRLGPTLYEPKLQNSKDGKFLLEDQRVRRKSVARSLKIKDSSERWLLHPGLITPGKGVNFLTRLLPHLASTDRLIVMGGQGPKARDREFAQTVVSSLRSNLGDRFTLVDSPADEFFKDVLIASDLVVLPYDAGVSERRSSFLSAASCGANIWTTVGSFSEPLQLRDSGAQTVSVDLWRAESPDVFSSLLSALNLNEQGSVQRRLQNLDWSKRFSWDMRARDVQAFLDTLDA